MEFGIEKGALVRELQTVTGVVEKRATLPILAKLLLEAGREGLQVGASDLEVTVRGTARASVVKEGSVTLPAAKLHEIARSLPDAEVQFKLLDRNQVAISCERTRYRISGQAREDFPKFPDLDVKRGIELPGAALREMIDRVAFAITTEDPRYSLNGALFLLEAGSMTLVANVMIAPVFLKEVVSKRDVLSTLLIVAGCAVAVAFASHSSEGDRRLTLTATCVCSSKCLHVCLAAARLSHET